MQHFQPQNYECGGNSRSQKHARSASKTNGSCHPKSGGGGQSVHHILVEYYGSGTEKTDTRHHLGSHTRRILKVNTKSILRHYAKQRAAERHQKVSAKSGIFGAKFSFYAYNSSEHYCHQES